MRSSAGSPNSFVSFLPELWMLIRILIGNIWRNFRLTNSSMLPARSVTSSIFSNYVESCTVSGVSGEFV